ncbi:cell division protein ZapD [Ostreibacterium oceani]|uniref:Cell division protein ZapD n=1 Tax=Ostreibacterium oceani TaxID=2654998 RepID=A0A6N7EWJ5_9GAMM|nr:cell division protein ZapD [Ostreibacterium oceani]MPV85487.1 cell division protein ZapD [Ostreibacterium oceani]
MTELTQSISQVYEQPLNERVRLLLRLEIIFLQAIRHKQARNQYETQMCLDALFALLNLTNRYELRSEILKELERIRSMLVQLLREENANAEKIDGTLIELQTCADILHGLDSKHIDRIRNIEFLNIIKQRNIHDTGSYLFEIPELQYWLLQAESHREKQIQKWLDDFMPFKRAIDFLLSLIRDSASPEVMIAENGIYLKTIDSRLHMHQLLRVRVDENYNVYPRISGGKHRFAIRFMEQIQADTRPKQTEKNVRFSLQTCVL